MVFYASFLTALFASMVLVAALMAWATRLGFVDVPDDRKVHSRVIPRIGGLGMVVATALTVWVWGQPSDDVLAYLVSILVIALFGLWDDRCDLDYRLKFLGQLLAVLVVVVPGHVSIETLSWLHGEPLPVWISVPLTVFFLLGVTNATNLADGLDGLASGVSLLSLVCVLVLAVAAEVSDVTLLSLAIIGGIVGFLRYNTHPALVFMGDTGSQFLGFSLGVLAIWLTQSPGVALAPELPLLILGLPVIDTLTVMTQRILHGRSPFRPDRNHLHHKLLSLGFDHYEAVVMIYSIQTVFVVSAYLLRYESAGLILGVYAVLGLLVVGSYPLALASGWRLHRFESRQESRFTGFLRRLRRAGWLPRWTYRVIALLVLIYLLGGVAVDRPWPPDVRHYAWAVIAVSVAFLALRLPYRTIVERLALYTLAILAAVALGQFLNRDMQELGFLRQGFFLLLGVLIALAIQLSRGEFFSVTPSDYLVIGVLLLAAFIPLFRDSEYTRVAVEAAVVLYGAEFILRKKGRTHFLLWIGSLIGLAVVGLQGYR